MNNTPISQILKMPPGSFVDCIQATVTDVYKSRTVGNGKTVQDAKLRDGTGAEITFSVWEHDDLSPLKGKEVIISAGHKGKIKVEFDSYKDRNVNKLSVSSTCTFQLLAVHQAQTGTPSTPTPSPANPNPASNPPTLVVNGQKVGMALNNATQFMVASGIPFGVEQLHKIASDIIRISVEMENGNLAPAGAKDEAPPF